MVLEHLLPERWLEKKTRYAAFLGGGYSIIGIVIARVLFPSDPSLVAVAFTSLLILPAIYKMFTIEQKEEDYTPNFSFKSFFHQKADFVKVYMFMALGIFLVYATAAVLLPSLHVNALFVDQLELRGASGGAFFGGAIFSTGLFWEILFNNWGVLLACFLIALLTGDGGIFIITWNASLWGVIFGITARNAAFVVQADPTMHILMALAYLCLVLVIVLPHAFLEILSYVLAAISGGLISKTLLAFRLRLSEFFGSIHWKNSVVIFVLALVFLLLGALLETYVLNNVTIYQDIIRQSFMIG
jgi:hypothetical protein